MWISKRDFRSVVLNLLDLKVPWYWLFFGIFFKACFVVWSCFQTRSVDIFNHLWVFNWRQLLFSFRVTKFFCFIYILIEMFISCVLAFQFIFYFFILIIIYSFKIHFSHLETPIGPRTTGVFYQPRTVVPPLNGQFRQLDSLNTHFCMALLHILLKVYYHYKCCFN